MPALASPVATVHFAVPPSRLGHDAVRYMDPAIGPSWPQEPFEVQIRDLRVDVGQSRESMVNQLERTGFAVLKHHSDAMGKLLDSEHWNEEFLKETAELVKAQLGASKVLIWNSVARSSDPKANSPYGGNHFQKEAIKGLQFGGTIRPTAAGAHVDQDAPNSLRMCKAAAGDDVLSQWRRVQQINVWRPISGPVTKAPLVVCDGRTVNATNSSIHCGLFGTRVVVHHDENQSWNYISRQTPDEVFLLKIFDSAVREGDAAYTPHTGCDIHGHDGAEAPRESIEVRVVVLYD